MKQTSGWKYRNGRLIQQLNDLVESQSNLHTCQRRRAAYRLDTANI